jgi:hypothetical protein
MDTKRFGIETYVLALRAADGDESKADELLESVYDKTSDFIWVLMDDDEITYFYKTLDKYPYREFINNEPTWLTQAIHDEVMEMNDSRNYVYVDGWGEEVAFPI